MFGHRVPLRLRTSGQSPFLKGAPPSPQVLQKAPAYQLATSSSNMSPKALSLGLIVVGIVAILGLRFPHAELQNATAAPAGSTFGTQKQGSISFIPSSTTATSTSILNSDSTDRFLTIEQSACQGVGTSFTSVSALTLKAATTSTASPGVVTNTNLAESITIATSSTYFVSATSTNSSIGQSAIGLGSLVWPAGSYLTFWVNATNSAVCTVGFQYVNN